MSTADFYLYQSAVCFLAIFRSPPSLSRLLLGPASDKGEILMVFCSESDASGWLGSCSGSSLHNGQELLGSLRFCGIGPNKSREGDRIEPTERVGLPIHPSKTYERK